MLSSPNATTVEGEQRKKLSREGNKPKAEFVRLFVKRAGRAELPFPPNHPSSAWRPPWFAECPPARAFSLPYLNQVK